MVDDGYAEEFGDDLAFASDDSADMEDEVVAPKEVFNEEDLITDTPDDDFVDDIDENTDLGGSFEVGRDEAASFSEDDGDYDVANAATSESHSSLVKPDNVERSLSLLSVPLNKLISRGGSSNDIASFVNEVFASVLEFDKFSEISSTYNRELDIIDSFILVDDQPKILVKITQANRDLGTLNLNLTDEVHSNRVRWLIITNGRRWMVYRDLGGEYPLFVSDFDFFDQAESISYFQYFTREMFISDGTDAVLDRYREHFRELAKEAMMSDEVLHIIRKALADKDMHIGLSVVRTAAKSIIKEN